MRSVTSSVVGSLVSAVAVCGLLAACGGGNQPDGMSDTTAAITATMFVAGALGDGCTLHGDCNSGFCDRTIAGGYCSAPCETHDDCGSDGYCMAGQGIGYCLRACEAQRECRSAAFQCFGLEDGAGVCGPDLTVVTPAAPNLGAPCSAEVECTAPGELQPYCVVEQDANGTQSGWTDGMCVAIGCEADADCGDGFGCSGGSMPFCTPTCSADAPCREGYVCDPDRNLCSPPR